MFKNTIALIQETTFKSVYYFKSFVKFLDSPFCHHVGLVLHRTTLVLSLIMGVESVSPGAH